MRRLPLLFAVPWLLMVATLADAAPQDSARIDASRPDPARVDRVPVATRSPGYKAPRRQVQSLPRQAASSPNRHLPSTPQARGVLEQVLQQTRRASANDPRARLSPPSTAPRNDALFTPQQRAELQRMLQQRDRALANDPHDRLAQPSAPGNGEPFSPQQRAELEKLLQRRNYALLSVPRERLDPVAGDLSRLRIENGDLRGIMNAARNSNGSVSLEQIPLLQRNPELMWGARQAQEGSRALERLLLPMFQDFSDEFHAELDRAANRSR